jgi:hypothetical protein
MEGSVTGYLFQMLDPMPLFASTYLHYFLQTSSARGTFIYSKELLYFYKLHKQQRENPRDFLPKYFGVSSFDFFVFPNRIFGVYVE